jgi:hypothetical protein
MSAKFFSPNFTFTFSEMTKESYQEIISFAGLNGVIWTTISDLTGVITLKHGDYGLQPQRIWAKIAVMVHADIFNDKTAVAAINGEVKKFNQKNQDKKLTVSFTYVF